mgnify:CR=1 FL=1
MAPSAFVRADKLSDTHATILDVRTGVEHAEKRLCIPHYHAPLDRLDAEQFMLQNRLDKNAPLYLLCKGGKRAAQAAEKFQQIGCSNVHVIEGGLMACESYGHALEGYATQVASDKRAPMSLERQVRIAAGALIAFGAGLALLAHPYFSAVPLAIGMGLVFAGITDRCGLALLLAKAPWNRIS